MKPTENKASGSEYVVDLNPDAGWTLTYDDSVGRLVFVFEPGEKPKSVDLDRTPLENNRVVVVQDEATRTRVDLAFERTKAFLVGCGYEVEAH